MNRRTPDETVVVPSAGGAVSSGPMWVRVAIVVLCAVLLLGGLTAGDLYRNEGLRASLAAEALAGGSWLVPTLHGEPHLTKPPGMSLLIAACSVPFGAVTTETARLPSVLAGAAAIGVVGWLTARAWGRRAGWLAAALLPCAPLWLGRAPSAEIDLVQLAWVTAALGCFLRATEPELLGASRALPNAVLRTAAKRQETTRAVGWWVAALLCVAGGFFTKWTAPAFFYLTAVPFLWWRGRLRLLLSPGHFAGAALFGALAIGWLVAVATNVGWPELYETLAREALLRFSPGHHPRPYPWDELITFPIGFLAGCLPWSLVAVFSLRPTFVRRLDERQRLLWLLAVCWLGSSLAFWALAPGHRPRHLLPAQPAAALLAAMAWADWLTLPAAWPRRAFASLLAGWLLVKLAFVGFVVPQRHVDVSARGEGEVLARLVPSGDTLHLVRLKDDNLLFYYGRPARRVPDPAVLEGSGAWCLLTAAEWRELAPAGEVRARLYDGQGSPIVLVRLRGRASFE
jgi:4-amino-4-deoxy-L-arabinose transferase-like glycosyltransferase